MTANDLIHLSDREFELLCGLHDVGSVCAHRRDWPVYEKLASLRGAELNEPYPNLPEYRLVESMGWTAKPPKSSDVLTLKRGVAKRCQDILDSQDAHGMYHTAQSLMKFLDEQEGKPCQ